MQYQPKKYAVLLGKAITAGTFAVVIAGCQTATQQRATLAADKIATQVCTIWTPVTDTTSPQVRGNNRAHYAFCPKKEKKQ